MIGNAAYQSTPRLASPINDAEDVAAALRRVGFSVELECDLSKPRMESAIALEQHAAGTEQHANELGQRVRALETEVAALRQRSQQLAELQQGGWWRLRTALLPLLELYWRLRGRPGGRRLPP